MKLNFYISHARILFGLALMSVFSTITLAQSHNSLVQYKNNFTTSNENLGSRLRTRPRIFIEPEKPQTEKNDKESTKPLAEISIPVNKTISTIELERQAFALLNKKRVENGLQPVVWNEEVAKVARVHSKNMAHNNFFSHQGLDGLMVNDRADSFGLRNWRRIGENIAYNRGYENPVEFAVLRWMQSQTHRENLLSDKWKESGVGIAVAEDGKTYYFTQVFMLRK